MKDLKDQLYKWKFTKSIALAYEILDELCDLFGIEQ